MAVTEVLRALGSWSIALQPTIPRELWDRLQYFGHVAIFPGQQDVRVAGDSLLGSARYVGVVRKIANQETYGLSGVGLAMWLGDEDGKGSVIESLLTITNQTLAPAVRLIVPPATSSLVEGTYFNQPGNPTFTGTFQWESQREALNYLCDTLGAEWRVNGAGTLDVGPASSLFVTNPVTMVARRYAGKDLAVAGFHGVMSTERDVEDFTTRVVLLSDDGSGGTMSASADIAGGLNPYLDLRGNAIRMTRLVSETTTDTTNMTARAQLQLNRFTSTRDALSLSTGDYDIKGELAVGDYLWVHDPDLGVVDTLNEVYFRGTILYPMKLRLTEMTWPVIDGMGVAYRDKTGAWIDLTNYLIPETGETTLVVGGFNKSLSDGADGGGGVRPQPQPNLTIPGAPTWTTPFLQGTYQSSVDGETKAQTQLAWTQPTNTDGSAASDLAYYEIRYRSATTPLYPVTHAQMAVFTHAQLAANGGTWGQPIQYPVGDWQYARVDASKLSTVLYELSPSMPYEANVRAVDNAVPANAGAWSTLASWQTAADTVGPSTPAAPSVAASMVGVQITHTLGRSTGGTFNLERDLHHLEVHTATAPTFQPDTTTLLGRMVANWGMITAQVPVVSSFKIDATTALYYKVVAVDEFGNKSTPSPAAVATAVLIDDAHISTLSVSKLTAGTVTASIIQAGWLRMGAGTPGSGIGPAVELTPFGIQAFNDGGVTFNVDAATGDVAILGELRSGNPGAPYVIVGPVVSGSKQSEIRWYPNSGFSNAGYVYAGASQNIFGAFGNGLVLTGTNFSGASTGPERGRLIIADQVALLGYQNTAISVDSYLSIDSGGSFTVKGKWSKTQTLAGNSALYVDQVGGSGTSASISYGATFSTTPLPLCDIQGTSGSPPTASSHAITARSTTGFSLQYPSGNCDIFIWAYRTS